MTYDATLAMNDDAMTEAVEFARRVSTIEGATLPINRARRLRDLVEMMARVIRTEPERRRRATPQSEATLDDAARYLRALWPKGDTLSFHAGDEVTAPCVRWRQFNWSGECVEVERVEGEAPSATLARLVARLREMAVAELDTAEARATALRAAIGGES